MIKTWNYVFRAVFFWINYYLRKDNKSKNNTAFFALLMLIIVQGINLSSVLSIINFLLKQDVINGVSSNEYGIIMFMVLGILNYLSLYRRRKEIFNKYENYAPERKEKGKSLFWLYIAGSVCILFFVGECLVRAE